MIAISIRKVAVEIRSMYLLSIIGMPQFILYRDGKAWLEIRNYLDILSAFIDEKEADKK